MFLSDNFTSQAIRLSMVIVSGYSQSSTMKTCCHHKLPSLMSPMILVTNRLSIVFQRLDVSGLYSHLKAFPFDEIIAENLPLIFKSIDNL